MIPKSAFLVDIARIYLVIDTSDGKVSINCETSKAPNGGLENPRFFVWSKSTWPLPSFAIDIEKPERVVHKHKVAIGLPTWGKRS